MTGKRIIHLQRLLLAAVPLLVAVSCSTTRRLADGEVLYTGVSKFSVNTPSDSVAVPGGLRSQLDQIINVKPNNPLFSPYVRTPFPIGLWVYNNWNDSAGGLKGWLYRKLVAQPVLISDVRPEVRTKMLEKTLDNNGFFNSSATYELKPDKHNRKKARIIYTVNTGDPYPIDSVILPGKTDYPVSGYIDSLARLNPYLRPGSIFSVDSLESVRVNITNTLRNKGFYYFRPEYIEFLADSTIHPGAIAIKLTIANNVPSLALKQWKTGNIYTLLKRRSNRNPGYPDTLQTSKGLLTVMRPQRVRPNMITSVISFRSGRTFSVRQMDRTQLRLSRLGIFESIEIQPIPADTSKENPTLDVYITCRYDRPMDASIEVNASSKSNSYIGPGLIFSLRHNNLFGGGEKLTLSLNGDYEWQTGSGASSVFNSYEVGLQATLAFPRLLAPSIVRRTRREINWTTVGLGASLLNRPHYFKMSQFNASYSYQWNFSRRVTNSFTPFKLTYSKLQHTTPVFDSIMQANPAIALSFMSQFIPQMTYTYNLSKFFEREQINGLDFTFTVAEAGNIFWGIWQAAGKKGEKKLFGTPFAQFVKGQAQIVYSRRLKPGTQHWLVSRFLIGAEHAYGNSKEVPYIEQFYIGGANSIRAFTVRSIGPGSYRPPKDQTNGYFDQTGTFKLEMNVEYRFPLFGDLHGAAFVDAGNVWLLRKDELRPGGELKANTFLRDIALGTGVGLRYDLGMMVIRADLGYGLHAPYADYPRKYFNIAFTKAFAFHLAIGYPF